MTAIRILDHGFIELVSRTGHVAASVVNAARCSFGSESDKLGERDQKLIAFLLGNGHTSPFRHAFFTFHVKAPLFVFRQWWKYQVGSTWREYELEDGTMLCDGERTGKLGHTDHPQAIVAVDIQIDTDCGSSWNELSGRYKVMELEFYVPKEARVNNGKQSSSLPMTTVGGETYIDNDKSMVLTDFMQDEMDEVTQTAIKAYERMLEKGIAKELARLVLPPTIYSECYWTVSLQAVLHFLDQRLKPEAQFEIREYAKGILDLIRPTLDEMGIER